MRPVSTVNTRRSRLATTLRWPTSWVSLFATGPRATTGLLSEYEDDDEPIPSVGDLSVVLDGRGDPLCVIRTVEVEVRPFGLVDEAFAWEGEGDRSLAHWREAHIRFFASVGGPVDDDTPVVLETFELLWSL